MWKRVVNIGICIYILFVLSEVFLFFSKCFGFLDFIVFWVYIIIDNIKNSNMWLVYLKYLYFVCFGRNNFRYDIVVMWLSLNLEYVKL